MVRSKYLEHLQAAMGHDYQPADLKPVVGPAQAAAGLGEADFIERMVHRESTFLAFFCGRGSVQHIF